jgi:hypothetical protein
LASTPACVSSTHGLPSVFEQTRRPTSRFCGLYSYSYRDGEPARAVAQVSCTSRPKARTLRFQRFPTQNNRLSGASRPFETPYVASANAKSSRSGVFLHHEGFISFACDNDPSGRRVPRTRRLDSLHGAEGTE